MKLKVNGKEENIPDGMTLLSYIESKGINPKTVIVEYNFDVPERETWGSMQLKENDNLEIVKFIGGG